MLTDESGNVEETYRYSAYGTVLDGNTDITPYLYNGQYGVSTEANGLNYMRARYYDSVSGRFINRDIVSGTIEDSRSLNRYAYCYGNPVSYADPFGLSPLVSMRNHAILDVLGMIPCGIGIAADLMNALYYIAEGDIKQAVQSVIMSAFSVVPGEIVKNIIGIGIGCFGIYGGLKQVKKDIDRYFANWDVYSNEERLLEAQILACHLLSLGGSIAGTISVAEGCVKSDNKTDYNEKVQEVQKNLTDTTEPKYDAATAKRVDELVSGGRVSESSGYKSGSNAVKNGATRAAQYSSEWGDASLQEAINKFAPNVEPVVTSKGKIIYNNPETGISVVYDKNGNYFRIEDTTRPRGRNYLDMDGNDMNNEIVNGKTHGRKKSDYQKVTHFNNIDR